MNVAVMLDNLKKRKNLSQGESEELMSEIMENRLFPEQVAAILTGLNFKDLTAVELASFVNVLDSYSVKIRPTSKNIIDTCGTGGDGTGTFNISTTSAFVIAGCGVNVAKHGNRSVSSGCGSADLFEKLGIELDNEPKKVSRCIDCTGIGFLFAPLHHPAFRNVSDIRKKLGVKTVFNMLGPLLNPAVVKRQLIGVFNKEYTEVYAKALLNRGTERAMIVHGNGMDEITICGETKVTELYNNNIKTYYIKPEDFGIEKGNMENLQVSDSNQNKEFTLSVLNGEYSDARKIVLMNSAAGLVVSGEAENFNEGIRMSADSVDSGKALQKLYECRRFMNE